MNRVIQLIAASAIGITVSACSGSGPTVPESTGSSTVDTSASDASSGASDYDSTIRSGGFIDDDVSDITADTMIIYFEYDKSEITPQYADILAGHARQLASDSTRRLRLEGHADERGSREYNIGLGERRAQAVRRLLLIQGASAAQISTVSYGEERPAAFGSTESDYEKNRRVELSYRR
ncbi:MAG: peptidoglycan-associated lipoprotein Pal [Pseudomonadota bacterium]